jgi:hypothetical protein
MMGEPLLTGGPWTYNDGVVSALKSGTGRCVAFVYQPGRAANKVDDANGRAIAELPTLLNMVKWCVNHDGECLGDHPALLETARAVIDGLDAL